MNLHGSAARTSACMRSFQKTYVFWDLERDLFKIFGEIPEDRDSKTNALVIANLEIIF